MIQPFTGEFVSVRPIELDEVDADEVCRILKIDQSSPKSVELIEDVENAISLFMVQQEIGRPDTVGEVKSALTDLKQAEVKARELLAGLSPSAQLRLDIALQVLDRKRDDRRDVPSRGIEIVSLGPTMLSLLVSDLEQQRGCLLEAIDQFIGDSGTYSGGRPMNMPDSLLAMAVAHAIKKATGTPPTMTKGGGFETLLRVALRIGGVKNWESKSLRKLVVWAARGAKHPS